VSSGAECSGFTIYEDNQDEILVWTDSHHLAPESEHLPLVDVWMRGLGAPGGVDEYPGMLCGGEALEHGVSLMLLSLLFGWDCWIVNLRSLRSAHLSHDDWCLVANLGMDRDANWISDTVAELKL
jgi:hypothetical protein